MMYAFCRGAKEKINNNTLIIIMIIIITIPEYGESNLTLSLSLPFIKLASLLIDCPN